MEPAWNHNANLYADRHVLLVGGGEVATSRVNLLLQADAKITIVSPEISDRIGELDRAGVIYKVLKREYEPADLTMYESAGTELPAEPRGEADYEQLEHMLAEQRFALVLTAIPDHEASRKIHYQCKRLNLQCNIADRPAICDFYFGAMYRRGPLQVMISSNGNSPRLTRRIKDEKIAPALDSVDLAKAVENLGYLRGQLRTVKAAGDDNGVIKARMAWNTKVTDSYTIDEWSTFSKADLDGILAHYPDPPK